MLEAEKALAAHQTGNNSGVIHSGLYYKPGSLKARNCVEGREAMYRFCQEHQHPARAVREAGGGHDPRRSCRALDELERRGRANGLAGAAAPGGRRAAEYEPEVAGHRRAPRPARPASWTTPRSPSAFARLVREAGGEVRTRARVLTASSAGRTAWCSRRPRGAVEARALINCAGLQSDRVARLCGVEPGVKIVPFRGEYYELVPERQHLVRNLIYPVPDPRFPFLGVHFTRMIHGGVEAGPNAVLAFRREGYRRTSFSPRDTLELFALSRASGGWRRSTGGWGFGEMYRSFSKKAFVRGAARSSSPTLRDEDVHAAGRRRAGAGARAPGALLDDFRIVEAERMIHVLNAPSPAATASISIGRTIADMAGRSFGLGGQG